MPDHPRSFWSHLPSLPSVCFCPSLSATTSFHNLSKRYHFLLTRENISHQKELIQILSMKPVNFIVSAPVLASSTFISKSCGRKFYAECSYSLNPIITQSTLFWYTFYQMTITVLAKDIKNSGRILVFTFYCIWYYYLFCPRNILGL